MNIRHAYTWSAVCFGVLICVGQASGQEKSLQEEATVGKHEGYAHAVAFSPDGTRLASTGHQDNRVRIWDVAERKELHCLSGHSGGAMSVRFSPDGKLLASSGMQDGIRLWDAATGKEVRCIDVPGHPYALTFAPDGKTLASSGIDRTVRVWDVATGRELLQIGGHTGRIWSVAFSPDGKRLASGDETGSVRVWEAATGRAVYALDGHRGGVIPVVYAPDGKRLASAGADEQIRLWDAQSGKELSPLVGHKGLVHDLAFSPDGRFLLSCGWDDKTLRLWELATGKEVWQIAAHGVAACSVAFAPAGRVVASVGRDAAVRVWDITGRARGGKLQPLPLKPHEVETAWQRLKGSDPAKAHEAAWTLIAAPKESVAYAKDQLRAVSADPTSGKRIAELITELGDRKFGVRDRASHLLGKMGRLAEPALRKALDTETSAEVRTRIKALLEKLEGAAIPPEVVPGLRAVMVLEQIGTPEARALLKELAGGLPDAWLTQEAQHSLHRLSKR